MRGGHLRPRDRDRFWFLGRGLRVGPSTLGSGSGRGLFVTRAVPQARGRWITFFDGGRLRPSVPVRSLTPAERSHTVTVMHGVWILDGHRGPPERLPKGAGLASYANDGSARPGAVNCALRRVQRGDGVPFVVLVNTRPLRAGEELFLNYGRTYWRTA